MCLAFYAVACLAGPPTPNFQALPLILAGQLPQLQCARRMVDSASAQHNGVAYTNGATAGDAVVLSLEEGHSHKQHSAAPVQQNGVEQANGLAPADAVVISLDEHHRHTHRNIMIGTHHFGERTHGGVQERHYKAVKYVGARAFPKAEGSHLSTFIRAPL